VSPPQRPLLYLVGATKAGTSALAVFLAQHPEIAMCRIKEPNFYAPDLDLPGPRSEREYLELFEARPGTRLLADASVLYLYSREAAGRIREVAPDARILAVLREPAETMAAWHAQMVYTGNEPLADFAEALDAEAERKQGRRLPPAGAARRSPALLFYRDLVRYAEQLERYLALFPREQIAVHLYDDFRADPSRVYADVIAFLGLRPFQPELRAVNPPKERRFPALHRALKRLFAAPARALLPARLRLDWLQRWDRLSSREAERAPLDPALAARLRREVRLDVERLAALLGRDLGAWLG
jgi:hypothetical protein